MLTEIQDKRLVRDGQNAEQARVLARKELDDLTAPALASDFTTGVTPAIRDRKKYLQQNVTTLLEIARNPFNAMVEVEAETEKAVSRELWYANLKTMINTSLDGIKIVVWTHPGFQVAISEKLNIYHDVDESGLTLTGVKPFARAKFSRLFPKILGFYEPGGSVGEELRKPSQPGLKSVKLEMTPEQVRAFISHMSGLMVVTGAPGSGKTTVAFQRIRFLIDQQDEATVRPGVRYSVEGTKIFLANRNLIEYVTRLLEEELQLSRNIVAFVPEFIAQYLEDTWEHRHEALLLKKKWPFMEARAREAFFSLCTVDDLSTCWKVYSAQIAARLVKAREGEWLRVLTAEGKSARKHGEELVEALRSAGGSADSGKKRAGILNSPLRMDRLFRSVNGPYSNARSAVGDRKKRKVFEDAFAVWLYNVYDPLECLRVFFGGRTHEGVLRIQEGTAGQIDEKTVVGKIVGELANRRYGLESIPWLAWLLRVALPEEIDPINRFSGIPCAVRPEKYGYGPWPHIVIDEAQDLSVAEASLISSLVTPGGALTVSSDFKQTVSPVHGMPDLEAIRVACPVADRKSGIQFPFRRNMRQTREITRFLLSFYEANFREKPDFEANDRLKDIKPQLHILKFKDFSRRIRQIWHTLKKAGATDSVAILQIDEDEDRMNILRSALEKEGIPLAPSWVSSPGPGTLITTSVERGKGLEFDVCIVLGLDSIEKSHLKYSTNRAYVAISRPSRRLAMLCEEFPGYLRNVNRNLFDVL